MSGVWVEAGGPDGRVGSTRDPGAQLVSPLPRLPLDAGLPPPGARIVVAMSGGVDSSAAAALLKLHGYDVIGVTLQLYDHGAAIARKGACCAGQDIHDARRVADRLGIAHYVLDYEQRFRASVMDTFADSYTRGETPIPCVSCNSGIKFSELLATARDLGATRLATGHYIRRRDSAAGAGLYRAVDAERDQSYFLFKTSRAQLADLIFPLGHLSKPQVRAFARAAGIATADKPDSQDICFVPSGHYSAVVEKLRPDAAQAGDIRHVDGRVLGRHEGVFRYTVGQRKGLGIAGGAPLYVIRIDAERREVVLGPRSALDVHQIALRDVNWLGDDAIEPALGHDGLELFVRVRSSQAPKPARLVRTPDGLSIQLATPEPGIAAGQACVFYSCGDATARVLGGGFIARALGIAGIPLGQFQPATGVRPVVTLNANKPAA
jgi:tRNA-specific 2-thiouridylase